MTADELFMTRALALAERGRGRTSPNPMVGAVVVDPEGVIVGSGSHEFAGGPHAEVHALAEAGVRARGATLYCTLEPCAHVGRTGPCAPLVVQAGVRRAVVAVEDPNPLVAGKGLAHLRDRGLRVEVGLGRAAAERLNGPFFTVMRHGRPFVTMKVALSRDRCVAAGAGRRTSLTGPASNRVIHRERAEVDAVAIGSGTAIADDPVLTARGAFRARPLARVIFDRRLRLPVSARLLATLDAGPIIVMTADNDDPAWRVRADALSAAGARLECLAAASDEDFLRAALRRLPPLGIHSVVLEGGPTLHRAAWDAQLVDRVQIFTTPRTLGGAGIPWLERRLVAEEALGDVRTVRLGDDVMVEGYVHRAG